MSRYPRDLTTTISSHYVRSRCLQVNLTTIKVYKLRMKNIFAAKQKYHKHSNIKGYDVSRLNPSPLFTNFNYVSFETRFNSLHIFILRGGKKMKKYFAFVLRHI